MVDTENEQEIWRTYPEYDFIEVSNLGRVRTKDRWVTCGRHKRLVKSHILKQFLRKNGYMQVSFGMNGKTINLSVHRAVVTCFIPNPLGLPQVNHIDNDPTNNAASNLEWCTIEYNRQYREEHGVAWGHPIIAVDLDAGNVFWFKSYREAGCQLGIDRSSIGKVVRGKRHKVYGWWFCYADSNAIEKTKKKFGDEVARKVEKLINDN